MFDSDRLDELLTDACMRWSVPGAVVAIGVGATAHVAAAGVVNIATGVTVTTDSLFQIGSLTKPWTAALVLDAVDEHGFDVDAPISSLVPELADGARRAPTVAQLLCHTGGLVAEYLPDTGRGDDCIARYVELVAAVDRVGPPGGVASYSNAGFVVLGRLIEILTGRTWTDVVTERLVRRLDLQHTVVLAEDAIRHRVAFGHSLTPGGAPEPVRAWTLPRAIGPAGGLVASAGDVVTFGNWHRRFGAVAAPVLAGPDAREPGGALPTATGWPTVGFDLGWEHYRWPGANGYGHGGHICGQDSYLRILPQHSATFVLLTNGGYSRDLFEELFTSFGREDLGLDLTHYKPDDVSAPASAPGLDGTYRRLGSTLTVAGDVLTIDRPDADLPVRRHRLVSCADGQVYARTSPGGVLSPLTRYVEHGRTHLHFGMRSNIATEPSVQPVQHPIGALV